MRDYGIRIEIHNNFKEEKCFFFKFYLLVLVNKLI